MTTHQEIAEALGTTSPKLYIADMARVTKETEASIRAKVSRGVYWPPPHNKRRKQGEKIFWRAVDVYVALFERRAVAK